MDQCGNSLPTLDDIQRKEDDVKQGLEYKIKDKDIEEVSNSWIIVFCIQWNVKST